MNTRLADLKVRHLIQVLIVVAVVGACVLLTIGGLRKADRADRRAHCLQNAPLGQRCP